MTSTNNNTFNPDDMFTGHLSYVSKSPIESIKLQSRLFPRNTDSSYPTPQSALYMGRFAIDHDSVSPGILPTGHWGTENEQSISSWGSQVGQIDPQTSQQEIFIYQHDTTPATLTTHSPYAMYTWKHWGRVPEPDHIICQIVANSNDIGMVPSQTSDFPQHLSSSIMNKYVHGAIGRVQEIAGHHSTVKRTTESSLTSAYNFYEDLNSFEMPDPTDLMFDEDEDDSNSEGSLDDVSLIGVEEEPTATDIEDDSSDLEVADKFDLEERASHL